MHVGCRFLKKQISSDYHQDDGGYDYQDQWGLRTVEWAKFTHKGTGMLVDIIIIVLFIIIILITITIMIMKVDHFNTHLCVCNGDQLLGSAKTIADTIAANRRSPYINCHKCPRPCSNSYSYSGLIKVWELRNGVPS